MIETQIETQLLIKGGVAAAIVAVIIIAIVITRKFWTRRKDFDFDSILTMETVTMTAANYLSVHDEIEAIAVAVYRADNLPTELSSVIRENIPAQVRHVVVLASVQSDEISKVVAVRFANTLDAALELSLKDGVFKIER